MSRIGRREFLQTAALSGTVACFMQHGQTAQGPTSAFVAGKKSALDRVTLGKTGITTSRLAMGTGTSGWGHTSNQTQLGADLTRLLRYGFDQGVTFWEAADQYGSHEFLAAGLKEVDRSKVVVLTKTNSETADGIRQDLDRFRKELGTDYIDIVLLHALEDPDWTRNLKGAMDALSEAKEKGVIRAHGCSCHDLGALKAAADSPWVDVDLARINPAGLHMDDSPAVVIPVLQKMKAAGKAVLGMKILGQGQLGDQPDRALRHAAQLECLDAFTIGFVSKDQLNDVVKRIPVVAAQA